MSSAARWKNSRTLRRMLQEVTDTWTVDLDGVTQGTASPEEALEARRHDDPGGMPAGNPTREAGDDTRVRYVFATDGNYTGDAIVIRLDDRLGGGVSIPLCSQGS